MMEAKVQVHSCYGSRDTNSGIARNWLYTIGGLDYWTDRFSFKTHRDAF